MTTKKFWRELLERAAKSAAQGAVAGLGAATFNILDTSALVGVGTGALTMFVLSVATSIASAPIGDSDSPSLV